MSLDSYICSNIAGFYRLELEKFKKNIGFDSYTNTFDKKINPRILNKEIKRAYKTAKIYADNIFKIVNCEEHMKRVETIEVYLECVPTKSIEYFTRKDLRNNNSKIATLQERLFYAFNCGLTSSYKKNISSIRLLNFSDDKTMDDTLKSLEWIDEDEEFKDIIKKI